MRRKALLILTLLLSLILCGCSLLPEEEEIRTAPVLRTVSPVAYTFDTVRRGDLVKSVRVGFKFVPVQTKGLSFPISGIYFDKMFVQAGDSVKKGQLLAQLDLEDLEEQIASIRHSMEELHLRTENLGEKYLLSRERCEILYADADEETRNQALADLEKEYSHQENTYGDQLYVLQMRLEQLEEKLLERQIFAPFDGTVTFVKKYAEGEKSEARNTAITLIDSTVTLFRAETRYWDAFTPGQVCRLQVEDEYLEATVTDEAALGLESKEKIPDKIAYVYLQLVEPNFQLEEGDYGYYTLILAERPDALHVSEDAVSYAGEQPIVYYLQPNGIKAYKPVETGITVDERIEILSGLEEGEQIIIN